MEVPTTIDKVPVHQPPCTCNWKASKKANISAVITRANRPRPAMISGIKRIVEQMVTNGPPIPIKDPTRIALSNHFFAGSISN
jgi:hypothetical protein